MSKRSRIKQPGARRRRAFYGPPDKFGRRFRSDGAAIIRDPLHLYRVPSSRPPAFATHVRGAISRAEKLLIETFGFLSRA